MDPAELVTAARDALPAAYAPYSEYRVGAALLAADGAVYTGCNVENANYSNSLHAEEVALGTAVADGARTFDAIAVTSAQRDGITPCGQCRQSLAEFCDEEFPVHCEEGTDGGVADADVTTHLLGDLLPETITAGHLGVDA